MSDGLDDVVAELGTEAPDAHVDDVRARVEAVAPDLLQQAGARASLGAVREQVLVEQELTAGERERLRAAVRRAAVRVEREAARVDQSVAVVAPAVAEARPHARDQFRKREWF